MTEYDFKLVDDLIKQDASCGFPGAVLHVSLRGKTIKHSAYGYKSRWGRTFESLIAPEPMENDTVFDLASNTKIFATTLSILKLVSEKLLNIDKEVKFYLPEFIHQDVTVRMLLSHSSGLGPEIWYFDPKNSLGKEFYSQEREKTKQLLLKTPLGYEPGKASLYSDTGFMLLGSVVEIVTGMELDKATGELIYKPLGLKNTCFNPIKTNHIAATSIGNTCNGTMDYPNIRKDVIRGEVQDEKAFYCMDGVAGHAGLFSNSSEVIKMCDLIQEIYHYGGQDSFFSREKLLDFITTKGSDEIFTCGWRVNRAHKVSNLFGEMAPELTIGHSGFTGTLSLMDLQNHLSIVLLTNKVHSFCYDRKHYAGSDFPTGKYAPVIDKVYKSLEL